MVMIQGESLGQRAADPGSDEALLARLHAGDELAFQALVDRHRPWLVRLCTRLLGHDAHAAEDVAQESLLKLHRAARDGRPLRVRPWLTVVARNTCIDEQRRRRPDLPGVLPERALSVDDPLPYDAALTDAWSQLSGRHREVLYLREVLGFSYKEIGAVMGLSMAATETLVFRARGALRREYERSGGTSFGFGLLGLQLSRLGLGGREDAPPGGRLAQFLATSLPAGTEQAVAKVLSVAAGVFMAAGAVLPGLVPFADAPAAGAAAAPPPAVTQSVAPAASPAAAAAPASGASAVSAPMTLKALLGNAAPADWAPQRSRSETRPLTVAAPGPGTPATGTGRITPVREAAAMLRPSDGGTLNRPVRGDSGDGPLRSLLPDRPARTESPEWHPIRALLADPRPLPLPGDPVPVEPPAPVAPSEPPAEDPAPVPAPERPSIREKVAELKDAAPGDGNVAGHDAALLRRKDR